MTTAVIVAWILWMHMAVNGAFMWVPLTGFETLGACNTNGATRAKELSKEDEDQATWYSCFPNGFDPRDANQKTR